MYKNRSISFTAALIMIVSLVLSMMPPGLTINTEAQSGYMAVVGDIRVQALSDTLVRIELKGSKGFEDRETYHIANRDWNGTDLTITQMGDMTQVAAENYTVHIPDNATSLSGIYITNNKGKNIWNYTSLPTSEQYLPDPGNTPNAWAIADNPRVVPAEWGYSPMPSSNNVYTDYNGWDIGNDSPDMYIFLPKGNYKQLLKDYISLTGPSEMVPIKSLGLWYSRYYDYKQNEALDLIDKFRDEGFPLDYFVVDTDWRENASTGYDINTNSWPDMQGFFQTAHNQKHVNIMFNDHPEPVNNQHALSRADLN